jgi:intraflagellar transport protein 56
MIMSRAAGAKGAGLRKKGLASPGKEEKKDKLKEYLKERDYTGALATLEFNRRSGQEPAEEVMTTMWIGYCAFHLGQFQRAFDAYQSILNTVPSGEAPPTVHLYQAACLFYLQMYKPCEEAADAYTRADVKSLEDKVWGFKSPGC